MTDPATIEKIARRYCELIGLDPEQRQLRGWPDGFLTQGWTKYADDVVAALAMSTAIKEVMKDE